jgi:two-component system sensor histidine kinase UhpB
MDTKKSAVDKKLDIVIIEDVPRDAAAMEAELRSEGIDFDARRLETRAQFLAALREAPPDIVLSDFTLPDFNALDALHTLQETRPEIPFILVTGTRSEEVAVECIKEGADDYILKASLKRLGSSVRNVLRKKAAERREGEIQTALQRSEQQYRLIAENTHDLISLLHDSGRFVYASPSFKTVLGYEPQELVGTTWLRLIHIRDRGALRAMLAQPSETQERRAAEFRARDASGRWLVLESIGSWIAAEHGSPRQLVLVSRDVTARREAEQQSRAMPRLIMQAQEGERRRLARELHDGVNQLLSSVKFRVQSFEERLESGAHERLRQDAEKTRLLLERAIEEVRHISRRLRPSELDDLGLAAALRSLCDEFGTQTRIHVRLSMPGLAQPLPDELELNLYRIIQEGLTNVQRHADATEVSINVQRDGSIVHASIGDNGRGFNPETLRARRGTSAGMGLMDMRERIALLGGIFELRSAPGAGTRIQVQIPLEPLASSAE